MAKKLLLRNIFGKPSSVNAGGGGVEVVDSLPSIGEPGKLYTTPDSTSLYTWDSENNKFVAVGDGDGNVRIASQNPIVSYPTLKHNKLVLVKASNWTHVINPEDLNQTIVQLMFAVASDELDEDVVRCYMGRFTIPSGVTSSEDVNVRFPTGTIIPDSMQEVIDNFESGHTYEFNIFHNVLLITDITSTNVDDTNRP